MDDPLWSQLLVQLILILINAFFAASEIAFLSINENKLKHLSEDGDKKAAKLLKIVSEPSGFLSTIQIGITLAGFLGSAFAADSFASRLSGWLSSITGIAVQSVHTVSVIIITLILSYFTLILGELVPKRVAMKKTEQVAKFACGFISFFSIVMRPVVWFLSKSTNFLLRLLGIDPNENSEHITEEEIMIMVDVGEEKGTIEPSERAMIENIFDFTDLCASDIMTHRTEITAVPLNATEKDILSVIEQTGFSRIPVFDGDIDHIIGILISRSYLLSLQKGESKPLSELVQQPYLVPESINAGKLFNDMQKKNVHICVVIDEYGGTAGILTMEDLLEEIVGNIYDEFDSLDDKDITPISPGKWLVHGTTPLDILGEELDYDFDDIDAETLSGLILAELNEIPKKNTHPHVEIGDFIITVKENNDRKIEKALVERKTIESDNNVK